ncbi:uncharacterized protein LOC117590212 isoform X2 [Drosophila guanche]|uniref:Transmembrane protein n=1 Tax=Drosophila guanche TaxID=7266 RepID=A0A3B0KTU1_DROGU|nr:uncharacterized protein LOC117590212 isoform X2 [Drosophila guanche]SPP88701.1 Hypothetical predicted protein [Drosophila guanche]
MSKCSDTTPQIPLVLEAETQTTPQYSFSDIELVEEEQEQTTPEYSYSDVEEQELEQPLGLPSNCGEVSYERRKKRLRHSLKECCFCVDLRVGCCFMGLFEMCSSAMCLLFGESNLLLYVGRLGYMVYLIGSAMLTVGALLEWHCLVRIYLFANVVHLLLCPLFILQHAQRTCLYCYYEILFLSLLLNSYLYLQSSVCTLSWWPTPIWCRFSGSIPVSTGHLPERQGTAYVDAEGRILRRKSRQWRVSSRASARAMWI